MGEKDSRQFSLVRSRCIHCCQHRQSASTSLEGLECVCCWCCFFVVFVCLFQFFFFTWGGAISSTGSKKGQVECASDYGVGWFRLVVSSSLGGILKEFPPRNGYVSCCGCSFGSLYAFLLLQRTHGVNSAQPATSPALANAGLCLCLAGSPPFSRNHTRKKESQISSPCGVLTRRWERISEEKFFPFSSLIQLALTIHT